jgi:5'-nucleotidase
VPHLAEVAKPFAFYDLDGITVAAIGMANWSSLTSIFEGDNTLGIRPIEDRAAVEQWVPVVRPAADLVVLVSHLGLDEDEGLAPAEVTDMNEALPLDGVDLILGGHLHIVLNPPKTVQVDEHGHPTLVVHSGAFAKYVGKLDLLVHKGEDNADPARRSFIKGFSYDNEPVQCGFREPGREDDPCPEPEDPATLALLQPYAFELERLIDLDGTFAFVSTSTDEKIVRNDPSGGDSQLGNLVARAMQVRTGVDADFAITNSLGIRADFEIGPLTVEQMYNVFPFENSITIMFLSGSEVRDTLDFVARKSSERGCRTQAQVAGISFKMVCGPDARAEEILIGDRCREDGELVPGRCEPLADEALYRVAVNDYIAAGGSGFEALKRNTSKQNTGISLRAALQDFLRDLGDCAADLIDPFTGENVLAKYGPITCLDETTEAHDDRIYPVFE